MTAYLSGLLAEMNGADGSWLASLWILGSCAVAGLFAALMVYGLPPAWQWIKVHASRIRSAFTRWRVAQINKANTPEPFPPEAVEWTPLLFIIPLVVVVVAIIRCNGVGL